MPSEEPLEWFVSAFNCTYAEFEDSETPISKEDVEYSWTNSYWAKCGPRHGDNRIYFAINEDWWDNHNSVERVGLLIHELAHYRHTDGHSPMFYDLMARIYNRFEQRASKFQSDVGTDFSLCDVGLWIVQDIEQHQVDTRKHTVYEARMEFANKTCLDIDEAVATGGVKVVQPATGLTSRADELHNRYVEQILFNFRSMQEVSDWLRNPRKDYAEVADRKSDYKISAIPVEETKENYVPADEHAELALSLMRHTGHRKVAVEIR